MVGLLLQFGADASLAVAGHAPRDTAPRLFHAQPAMVLEDEEPVAAAYEQVSPSDLHHCRELVLLVNLLAQSLLHTHGPPPPRLADYAAQLSRHVALLCEDVAHDDRVQVGLTLFRALWGLV